MRAGSGRRLPFAALVMHRGGLPPSLPMSRPRRPFPPLHPRALAVVGALVAVAPVAGAQATPTPPGAPADSAAPGTTPGAVPAAAQAPRTPRVTVHGYLTQALAMTTGAQFYGATVHPSTDFRYAAVQVRFAATPQDLFLVQLNHRRLGRSPITTFESDLNVNWAFYQRTFGDGTALKVGRIAIPRGIYNELRSVGLSLPTYRPPVVLYDEGAYFSETIDGVVASRTFFDDRPWRVEAHAYAGGWRSLMYDTWSETYAVSRARAEGALGGQLWLETPLDGVRVGLAAQRYRYTESPLGPLDMKEWHASFDATRERGFVRSEVTLQDYGTDKYWAGYVQGGVRATRRLTLVAELQRARDTEVTYGDGTLPRAFDWHRSTGLAMAWTLTPNFVFKAEHHWQRGIQVEQPGDPRRPPRFRYVVAGLSAGF